MMPGGKNNIICMYTYKTITALPPPKAVQQARAHHPRRRISVPGDWIVCSQGCWALSHAASEEDQQGWAPAANTLRLGLQCNSPWSSKLGKAYQGAHPTAPEWEATQLVSARRARDTLSWWADPLCSVG